MQNQICKICLKKISGEQKNIDYHNACLLRLFDSITVSPILPFSRDVFKTEISRQYSKGMSISGVQKKLSMRLEKDQLILTSENGTYILKPTVEDFPELSENEHLSMVIGKTLDIDTPPLGLIKFSDGELVYIIRRFDWNKSGKIHKEDMAQIFNLHRDTGETYKYSQSYEQVGNKLVEVTGGKLAIALDFFNRVIFNFLIQNGDYHLKNISVISSKLSRSGIYEGMSPNYDSVMTRMYSTYEKDLALDLLANDELPKESDAVGFLTKADFIEFGARINLLPPAMELVFEKIRKKSDEIFNLIDSSFLSDQRKAEYKDNVINRMQKLKIGLIHKQDHTKGLPSRRL